MSEYYNDVMVVLDGENGVFKSYMNCDEVNRLQTNGGLSQAEQVNLRETEDRPVPESLKDGTSMITDVWVTIIPGPAFSGN